MLKYRQIEKVRCTLITLEEYFEACVSLFTLQIAQHEVRTLLKQYLKFPRSHQEEIRNLRRQLKINRRGSTGLRKLNKITRQYWQQK
jgi:hypothetical protein